ncbi:MAG: hypothetical protein HOW73_06770 [Polyangiaceae bacterium]|nr:hypothetical protein [Polyangiaceae bacterium]
MGMFDHYEPHPPLACPNCGTVLAGFQGKDGENALVVWRQGAAAPTDHPVDAEWRLAPEVLERLRLPERFEFYTTCERCQCWAVFTGFCTKGLWTESVLGNHLRSGETIPARSVAQNWRQCSRCIEAWQHPDSIVRAGCPHCHALTRLEPG